MIAETIRSEKFWLRKFDGHEDILDFKIYYSGKTDGYNRLETPLPPTFRETVMRLTRGREYSVLAFFLVALRILIHEYFQLSRVFILTPVSRDTPSPFADNMLFLKTQLDPLRTVRETLNDELQNLLESFRFGEYDRETLEHQVRLNFHREIDTAKGIAFCWQRFQRTTPLLYDNPLVLDLTDTGDDQWLLIVSYTGELEKEFVQQFNHRYIQLLTRLSEGKMEATLADLTVLPEISKKELLTSFSRMQQLTPAPEATLQEVFKKNARATPDKIAVYGKERDLTYAGLDERSDQLAGYLIRNGARKGEPIALFMPAGFEMVVSQLAVLKAGAVIIAIDVHTAVTAVERILSHSRVTLLLTTPDSPSYKVPAAQIDVSALLQNTEERSGVDTLFPLVHPGDAAFLFYTSGSTGVPKGVLLSHKNIGANLDWVQRYFKMTPDDVIPQKSSVSFIDSIFEIIYPVTWLHAAVYLRPFERINYELPEIQVKWYEEIKATWLILVSSVLKQLAPYLEKLDSLQHVCVGGEEVTGHYKGHFNLYNAYGLSECSGFSSIHRIPPSAQYNKIPIGIPIDNTSLYVLDNDRQLVAPYIPGDLYVGGECVGMYFLDAPDLTAERFLPDPFRPGHKMYKTGDLACWNTKAELVFLGRKDRQVKIRGIKVDISEVETMLLKIPGTAQAAVIIRRLREEDQLIAFVTGDNSLSPSDIKTRLTASLHSQAVPTRILLLPEMPATATGKIDRIALAHTYNEQLRDLPVTDSPETHIQFMVCAIWKEVLGRNDIGIRDNFFMIGGHSLNLVMTITRINERLGCQLRADDMLRYPSIEQLADFIEQGSGNGEKVPARFLKQETRGDLITLNQTFDNLPNLVILHPFAGIAYGYRGLGSCLEGKVNVYGINAKGLFDSSATLPSSFEEAAAQYNTLIEEKGLTKNLYICGYSASIAIAFEMAKKMESGGSSPNGLFLVDDYLKANTVAISRERRNEIEIGEMTWGMKNYFGLDLGKPAYKEGWFADSLQPFGDDQTRINGLSIAEIKRCRDVIINLFDCLLQYSPRGHVKTPMTYFFTDHYKEDRSWEKFAAGKFETSRVHGLHNTVFLPEEIEKNCAIFLKSII